MESQTNNVKTSYFTETELEVAKWLSRGYSEKEIAVKLKIAKDTVNNHTRHIRKKNGLSKNIEIVLLYIAYLRGKEFSLQNVREIGISSIFIIVNICDYIQM